MLIVYRQVVNRFMFRARIDSQCRHHASCATPNIFALSQFTCRNKLLTVCGPEQVLRCAADRLFKPFDVDVDQAIVRFMNEDTGDEIAFATFGSPGFDRGRVARVARVYSPVSSLVL